MDPIKLHRVATKSLHMLAKLHLHALLHSPHKF